MYKNFLKHVLKLPNMVWGCNVECKTVMWCSCLICRPVQVLATVLLIQLPSNVSGKEAEDGPSTWAAVPT